VQQYAANIAGDANRSLRNPAPLRRYFVSSANAPFQSSGGGAFR
jgi:hypothetical protein